VEKLFAEMESLDAETATKDEMEAAGRRVAISYGDYPDSIRCRVDTLKKGIRYR
jgi:hypothetical protein